MTKEEKTQLRAKMTSLVEKPGQRMLLNWAAFIVSNYNSVFLGIFPLKILDQQGDDV
jgi:hypothetical protein